MKKLITMEDYKKFVKLVTATYNKNGEYTKKELALDEYVEFVNFGKNNAKEFFWFLPVWYTEEYGSGCNCNFEFNLNKITERLNKGLPVWTRIEDRWIKVIL